MRIREATDADRTRLVAMGMRFIAETPYARFGASPQALEWILRVVLEHGAAFVAEVDGRLVGMLAVIVAPHPLTGVAYADEIVWWVEPEYRAGMIGPRLLHTTEKWARTKGVPSIRMVAPAGSQVGRFYEHRGYEPIETSYLREL